MYLEEKAYLKPLPAQSFRFFRQETRTVDDAGLVQVDCSYYAAMPAALYSEVTVRVYEREVEILDDHGQVLRRPAAPARATSSCPKKIGCSTRPEKQRA
jgi:hypothetical protein